MSADSSSEQETKQPDFSFGKRLSTARGALNLSREEVSKELHLGLEIITALEEEDYEKLTAPIFVNGYLRNYARLLKIPVEPLLAAYSQIQVDQPALVSDAARSPKPAYSKLLVKTASLLIILVLIAGIVSWLQSQDFKFPDISSFIEEAPKTTSVEPDLTQPVLPALPEVVDSPAPNIAADLVEEESTEEIKSTPELVSEPVESVALSAPVEELGEQAKNELLISINEDSWVEVSDNDGKRLIYDLLRQGKEHRVSGSIPFKVFLGNANGVKIEYNGAPINIAEFTRGNLARFKIGVAGE